jgi:hypothetical protein
MRIGRVTSALVLCVAACGEEEISFSGAGGGTALPCGIDCSTIVTSTCFEGSCNAETKTCEVVAAPEGTSCDDGLFCTTEDACDGTGVCAGGPMNTCGATPTPCGEVSCKEETEDCDISAIAEGEACVLNDECIAAAHCRAGRCTGEPKDCSALTTTCTLGACDPDTGECVAQPMTGACDDGDDCTGEDMCSGDSCAGVPIVQCVTGDGCCPVGCASPTDNDCIRPDIFRCGTSARSPLDFTPPPLSFQLYNSCFPGDTVQAIFITSSFGGGISAADLQTYLTNGGIAITEFGSSDEVFGLAFGAVMQGGFFGACTNCLPLVHQFSPGDPFWQANAFVPDVIANAGCGFAVTAFPGVTPIAGWSANDVAVAYRDLGAGRLWLTDFDWGSGQVYPCLPKTEELMGYMMTHK